MTNQPPRKDTTMSPPKSSAWPAILACLIAALFTAPVILGLVGVSVWLARWIGGML